MEQCQISIWGIYHTYAALVVLGGCKNTSCFLPMRKGKSVKMKTRLLHLSRNPFRETRGFIVHLFPDRRFSATASPFPKSTWSRMRSRNWNFFSSEGVVTYFGISASIEAKMEPVHGKLFHRPRKQRKRWRRSVAKWQLFYCLWNKTSRDDSNISQTRSHHHPICCPRR